MHQKLFRKEIKEIQFGLLSPEEIRSSSVVRVEYPETMENGVPKNGGLIDCRMGTTERGYLCSTCGQDMTNCVGHHGHIELTKPLFHISFLSKIKKVLESICFYCSKLKIDKKKISMHKMDRMKLSLVWKIAKSKSFCQGDEIEDEEGVKITGCGSKQPLIKKEGLSLVAFMKGEESTEGKVILNGEKVYNIFKKISDEDAALMGFDLKYSRPEWMLITVLLVPPPAVRPSIVMEGVLRGEDDLTHKLSDIIKANNNLKKYESEGAPPHIFRDYEQLLQFHVATLMNNDISGQPQSLQKSGRPLKSLSARLKGKEGRIRGNLMGKRVDFSARSVITPDPNIDLTEVGVPKKIAMIHTFPERVTSFNIDKLTHFISNGPDNYPGANYVTKNDGTKIDLRYNRDINLKIGYVVERHMLDGDYVLFNRQPSLHKMSMMCHKAKIMDLSTFRLNLSATSPYGADFDGDEMNLHMPQSHISRVELKELLIVSKQIISPQSNKPVIGIVQDTLLGVRKFTQRDNFLKEREFMQIIYNSKIKNINIKPAIRRPVKLFTGKQIFSCILPKINFMCESNGNIDFNEIKFPKNYNFMKNNSHPFDTQTFIQEGILHTGIIDTRSVGRSQGNLIHVIFNEFGHKICEDFINNLQRIINIWLTTIQGFSIGIGDTIADDDTMKLIVNTIDTAKENVRKIIKEARNNKLERKPGLSLRETFESNINLVLNKARDVSGTSAQKSLKEDNNVKQMVLAGSKGSFINISQVTASVGQQNVENNRIPFGFRYRTLPHFCRDDYGPESRGFVENSFLSGLTPEEFFFHAMGGREGLIDTAIKTAETGYIQRRLIKSMENSSIKYDRSVRDFNGKIIQFLYGDDGYDGSCLEINKIKFKNENINEFLNEFKIKSITDIEIIKNEFEEIENLEKEIFNYEFFKKMGLIEPKRTLPVNFNRLFWEANRLYPSFESKNSLPTVKQIQSLKLELIEKLKPNKIFEFFLKFNLSTKNIFKKNISFYAYKFIINKILELNNNALISMNEMVGTLASQSIGEPATQMTLNTFHYAGVSATVTKGVPRLKELINVAKNIRTPSLIINLKPEFNKNLKSVTKIQSSLEYLKIKDILLNSQIIYDPNPNQTVIKEDYDLVTSYYEFPDTELNLNLSKWLLRLQISRNKLLNHNLKIIDLVTKLENLYKNDIQILNTDENSEKLIIRIRAKGNRNYEFYKKLLESICGVHLKGYKGIKKAFICVDEGDNTLSKERSSKESDDKENDNKEKGNKEKDDKEKDDNLMSDNKEKDNINDTLMNDNKYYLKTEGINLLEILSDENLDSKYIISNSIIETLEVLGIEACRQNLFNELRAVIESDGGYVNYRHLGLLSDTMTIKGNLSGITRHGFNRSEASALMRASFEETVDVLMESAMVANYSSVLTVTENIMLGQIAPVGTGCSKIILDLEKISETIPLSEFIFEFEKNEIDAPNLGTPILRSPESISNMTPDPYSPSVFDIYSSDNPSSGIYSPNSPRYSPLSPGIYSPNSPRYSPSSPGIYSPSSPRYNPSSPRYNPSSPRYNPSSPRYSPSSPRYNPSSPRYNPSSPGMYSPTSPKYSPESKPYSPTTPLNLSTKYSPSSPYRPTSPYAPTSPKTYYSPTSPSSFSYTPASPGSNLMNIKYSPKHKNDDLKNKRIKKNEDEN